MPPGSLRRPGRTSQTDRNARENRGAARGHCWWRLNRSCCLHQTPPGQEEDVRPNRLQAEVDFLGAKK